MHESHERIDELLASHEQDQNDEEEEIAYQRNQPHVDDWHAHFEVVESVRTLGEWVRDEEEIDEHVHGQVEADHEQTATFAVAAHFVARSFVN